jgi:hypothetical protein
MRILDFGKNKNKVLAECDEKYLRWLVTHEQVLAKRNRWAARDAKYILERREQAIAKTTGNENWQEWHGSLIAKPVSNDIGTRGNLNVSRPFSLMR